MTILCVAIVLNKSVVHNTGNMNMRKVIYELDNHEKYNLEDRVISSKGPFYITFIIIKNKEIYE